MCFVKINKRRGLILGILIYLLVAKIGLASIILNLPFFSALKYASYLARPEYSGATKMNSGMGIILRYFYTFVCYLLCDEKKCSEKEFSAMTWLFLALILTDSLGIQITIFQRLTKNFWVAYFAMYKIFFRKTKNGYVQLGQIFCVAYVLYFVFYLNYIVNNHEVIPYTHIPLSF